MKVVRTLALALVTTAFFAGTARSEERERTHGNGSPAPFDSQRPPDDSASPSIDTLRKTLKESAPGSAAYWTAAHALLKALGTDTKRIDDIEAELAERRKSLFQELRKARGNADSKALLKTSETGAGDAKEAARAEIDRRISDPNVQFVMKEFGGRPESALSRTEALLAALQANDDKKLGELVARIFGTIGSARRDTMVKHVEELLKSPEKVREKGLNEKLLQKFLEAGKFTQDKASVTKNAFLESFEKTMVDVDKRSERFHLNVARVLRGGPDGAAALKQLLEEYDRADLVDHVNLALADGDDGRAVDTIAALAREDKDGNLFLDLEGSNFAFGDRDKNQSLFLGKKGEKEQIRAALAAFQTGEQRGHDGELNPDFNGAKTDRLQRFRLASAPSDSAVRLFAGEGEGGRPTLRRTTTPVPTDKVAKQTITKPNQLPTPPPPETPTPTPTPTSNGGGNNPPPPPPGGPTFAEVKAFLETPKCQGCHQLTGAISGTALGNMAVRGKGLKLALANGLNKMSSAQITPAERQKLQRFLNAL